MTEKTQYLRLLSEARSGSHADLNRLATLVRDRLYPFVFRNTINHDCTEDILQETLLAMIQQLAFLRQNSRFWPWIYQIARSKILQDIRCQQRQSAIRAAIMRSQSLSDRPNSHGSSVDATIHEERLQQLSAAVQQLAGHYGDIIQLRGYRQLPYTEIASITHSSPQKARVCFHRAKKTLRARLRA